MKKILSLLILLCSVAVFSQRTCDTSRKLAELKNTVPGFAEHHQDVMEYIQNPNNEQANVLRGPNSPAVVVTIPVVFHVFYKNATQILLVARPTAPNWIESASVGDTSTLTWVNSVLRELIEPIKLRSGS